MASRPGLVLPGAQVREINGHPTIDPKYGLGDGPFALPGKGSDQLRMFVKTPVRADASGAFQWIPADNNSFIRCLFHAANNRLPALEEIASLRKAIWHGGGDANAPSVAEHEEDEAGSGDR